MEFVLVVIWLCSLGLATEDQHASVWIFLHYTLDMAVCPYLASIFGMPIWHPTTEAEVDELMAAEVSV